MSDSQEAKHTPLPWRTNGRYKIVRDTSGPTPRVIVDTTISGECDVFKLENTDHANANFIELACNAHYELLAENEKLQVRIRELNKLSEPIWPTPEGVREDD